MNKQWKQPTPTDIRNNENIDLLTRLIFLDILNGCQNEDYLLIYFHGNKRVTIPLKRGQYFFQVKKYADAIECDRRKIEKSLEIISNWYTEMQIERTPFGLIITIKDYDSLIRMHNETHNECTTNAQRMHTQNKSDKSNKNISKDIGVETPVYGNPEINRFITGVNKHLGYNLPGDGRSRRVVKTILTLLERNGKNGVKEGREFLDDDKWENARRFMGDYLAEKVDKGFGGQSWQTIYRSVTLWLANGGNFPETKLNK